MNYTRRWINFSALLILVGTLAVGCRNEPSGPIVSSPLSPASVPTSIVSPTVTSIPAPTTTSTPSPTPIPISGLPVLAGTLVPQPQVPINPENVNKMVELALWGKGQASRVAYSPDGQLLAVGTSIGIWLYDAQTLQQLRFINTGNTQYGLAFSSDSMMIFAKVGETTISRWNVATGERLGSLDVGKGGIAAFFLRGAWLVAVAEGKQIGLWDIQAGKRMRTLAGHANDVSSLAFSPDGTLLASGSLDNSILLWDVKTGHSDLTLKGHGDRVTSLAFTPDSSLLASGSYDDTVRVWNVKTGTPLWVLEGNKQPPLYHVDNVVFSPNGAVLASGGADDKVRLWDMKTGTLLRALEIHRYSLMDMAFSTDGMTLAFVDTWEKAVQLWDIKTNVAQNKLTGYQENVSGLAISPDGTIFVSHFEDGKIELWNPSTGQIVHTFEGNTDSVPRLALSADGTTLAAVHAGRQAGPVAVWAWDVAAGQRLRRLPGDYTRGIVNLALSPDGKMIAISTEASLFHVYDVQTGKELYGLVGGYESDLVFSPDGRNLFSGTWDFVNLWSIDTGKALYTLKMPGPYTSGAVSPDSRMIATGSYKGTIWLWDVETGKVLLSLKGQSEVGTVAFSSDGKLLVSRARNGTVSVWDVSTGRLLRTLGRYAVNFIAFSLDSRMMVLGLQDGTVRLWGVPPD